MTERGEEADDAVWDESDRFGEVMLGVCADEIGKLIKSASQLDKASVVAKAPYIGERNSGGFEVACPRDAAGARNF
jgi:hypothetical protein